MRKLYKASCSSKILCKNCLLRYLLSSFSNFGRFFSLDNNLRYIFLRVSSLNRESRKLIISYWWERTWFSRKLPKDENTDSQSVAIRWTWTKTKRSRFFLFLGMKFQQWQKLSRLFVFSRVTRDFYNRTFNFRCEIVNNSHIGTCCFKVSRVLFFKNQRKMCNKNVLIWPSKTDDISLYLPGYNYMQGL